jgi:hypothetical protein
VSALHLWLSLGLLGGLADNVLLLWRRRQLAPRSTEWLGAAVVLVFAMALGPLSIAALAAAAWPRREP